MARQGQENIVISWLVWHFLQMPMFLFFIWKNFIYFGLDFFSMPLLAATLISPWRRYKWQYPRGFDIRGYFEIFISNIFSRLIGLICRSFLIIVGVIAMAFIFAIGGIFILFWILEPFILAALIFFLVS